MGESTAPTSRLLAEAIYIQPDLRIPLAHPDYIEFRAQLLSEMMSMIEQINGIKRGLIGKRLREIESDTKFSEDQRTRIIGKVNAIQGGEVDTDLQKAYQDSPRCVIEEAIKIEDAQAARFTDLVEEARRLQELISRDVVAKYIERLAEDGVPLTPEYISCIQERLNTRAVKPFVVANNPSL